MKLYYKNSKVKLFHGDCLDVMCKAKDNSVDAIVTDPLLIDGVFYP